jgi:hypothetical protein
LLSPCRLPADIGLLAAAVMRGALMLAAALSYGHPDERRSIVGLSEKSPASHATFSGWQTYRAVAVFHAARHI